MASWIAWHSAQQIVSTLCFLVLIAALLVDCNAQSLERGVRAPKNKFIRFGRSGAKSALFDRDLGNPIDDSEPAFELTQPDEAPLYLVRPFATDGETVLPIFRANPDSRNKRGGQKFIRFGRK